MQVSDFDQALADKWNHYRHLANSLETGPDRDRFDLALVMFSADLRQGWATPIRPTGNDAGAGAVHRTGTGWSAP